MDGLEPHADYRGRVGVRMQRSQKLRGWGGRMSTIFRKMFREVWHGMCRSQIVRHGMAFGGKHGMVFAWRMWHGFWRRQRNRNCKGARSKNADRKLRIASNMPRKTFRVKNFCNFTPVLLFRFVYVFVVATHAISTCCAHARFRYELVSITTTLRARNTRATYCHTTT